MPVRATRIFLPMEEPRNEKKDGNRELMGESCKMAKRRALASPVAKVVPC
jgi:hypothetical protein